uniref:GH36-type glycosyl hydrolase domain-containing protein n=1 Tax=uncultured Draconibacterium sp. TaxID=1573823 RepID=UPI0032172992
MKTIVILILATALFSCTTQSTQPDLKDQIKNNEYFAFTKNKALEVVKTGFNAGDGYGEVWIRDYNTFIELSAEVYPQETLKENLRVFFRLQREDGNIIDGFIPKEKAQKTEGGYDYIFTDLEPNYAGHKNTVETDHETSLVQAVYKYVKKTGDKDFLNEKIGDKTVAERLEWSMEFLLNHRWSEEYGLIWGATTADWGDVQHCHPWGVYITDDTKYCLDIYDNAMFLIALNNLIEMVPARKEKWQLVHDKIAVNTMKYLWDKENQKFIPHVYLDGSPYPADFNENEIYYHGGTAVAIEAGLLSKEQIKISLNKMIENVKASGAGSIGLTMYPPYPAWAFDNKGMYEYGYQNGGDWTWFGGRMIQQLIKNGFVAEAYEQMQPMVKRVKDNDGFYEWYTVDNKPEGSGTFRGSAGVLYKAILMFEEYANRK